MMNSLLPKIDLNRCDRCGICITACPENALLLTNHGPIINAPHLCTYCTTCEDVCPQKAIRTPLFIAWASAN
jgi:NAD-dependent dihydropyrimidine dehydrogenase PreA subunit